MKKVFRIERKLSRYFQQFNRILNFRPLFIVFSQTFEQNSFASSCTLLTNYVCLFPKYNSV